MEIKVDAEKLSVEMAEQIRTAEIAVTRGIRSTSNKIKESWRDDVRRALNARLATAIRSKVYPESEPSLEAAGLVYARPSRKKNAGAARIIAGHETGAVIRGYEGLWLAIPTEEAGRGRRGGKITPVEWERRTGNRLRFVYRARGASFLVADVKLTKKGNLGRGRMTKTGAYASGTFTGVIFFLVPQAKLRKRLDLMNKANRLIQGLPDAIVKNWPG